MPLTACQLMECLERCKDATPEQATEAVRESSGGIISNGDVKTIVQTLQWLYRPQRARGLTGLSITELNIAVGGQWQELFQGDVNRRMFFVMSLNTSLWIGPKPGLTNGEAGWNVGWSYYPTVFTEEKFGVCIQQPWYVMSAGGNWQGYVIQEYYVNTPARYPI